MDFIKLFEKLSMILWQLLILNSKRPPDKKVIYIKWIDAVLHWFLQESSFKLMRNA